MASKLTRRALLAAGLGASQFALLERFGLMRSARADAPGDGPTRLLVLYLPGGVRFYPLFVPMSDAEIAQTIPPPADALGEPIFSRPADMVTLDGDSGGFAPLRIGRNWNPADPGDRTGYRFSPMGYGWIHHGLAPTTAVLHGVDQGSFAHGSAYVSAMCGVPASDYRAPAFVSVIANHLHQRFSSSRPIACVAVSSSGVPRAPGLPSSAAPTIVPSVGALAEFFSSSGTRHRRWLNSDARTPASVPGFNGTGTTDNVGLTSVDAQLLARTRGLRGVGPPGTDAVLEQIYGSYTSISRTLASDVVTAVQAAMPTTLPPADYARAFRPYGFNFGLANGSIDMTNSCEWILRLLKSNVTSAVYAALPEFYYDFHNGSTVARATAASRAQLDIISRMMGEMKATPSPDRAGRTLYDDTLVVVLSEFNRSWMRGPNQDSVTDWEFPDDHNPVTSVVLSGGGICGNRQIGGFAQPSAAGLPVSIIEESGEASMRPPLAADAVATIASVFGLRPNTDFFIPGGYGVIQGLQRT